MKSLITIEDFILEQQRISPEITGNLVGLLYDISVISKVIAGEIVQTPYIELMKGITGLASINPRLLVNLKELATITFNRVLSTGRIACLVTRETGLIQVPSNMPPGKYVLIIDLIIDVLDNHNSFIVGMIFSIYQRKSETNPAGLDDVLQPASDLIAAGYVIFGIETIMVYSSGSSVNMLLLNPNVGEFLLCEPEILLPNQPKYYSINIREKNSWVKGIDSYVSYLGHEDDRHQFTGLINRFTGSLLCDFHRNLLDGGVSIYPESINNPINLIFNAAPLAWISERAGGQATNGMLNISEIIPSSLNNTTQLIIGEKSLVKEAKGYLSQVQF